MATVALGSDGSVRSLGDVTRFPIETPWCFRRRRRTESPPPTTRRRPPRYLATTQCPGAAAHHASTAGILEPSPAASTPSLSSAHHTSIMDVLVPSPAAPPSSPLSAHHASTVGVLAPPPSPSSAHHASTVEPPHCYSRPTAATATCRPGPGHPGELRRHPRTRENPITVAAPSSGEHKLQNLFKELRGRVMSDIAVQGRISDSAAN
uniref:Uncharacterized protein n=1 Tax=Oryza glumipatula TaxID=40148 RepID=A0A0D9ZJZ2_9ORYZ